MAERNNNNIANGIIAGIAIAVGIIISAVIAALVAKLSGSDVGGFWNNRLPVWALGFGYMVPGIIGVISAFVRRKGMYITQMVINVFTILVMGVFCLISVFAISGLGTVSPARCSSNDCRNAESYYVMGITVLVMIILGWLLVLADTIIIGMIVCKQTPTVVVQTVPTNATADPALIAAMDPRAGYANVAHYTAKPPLGVNPQVIYMQDRQATEQPPPYAES